MVVKVNHKDKSLAKKVLLSVVAAGVMSGFVLSAEAAEGNILEANGQNVIEKDVAYDEVIATASADVTLNGGKVRGWKEKRYDDQEPTVAYADIAADISDESILKADNVDFIGGIEASGGSKIILNGGSVTAGNFYDSKGNILYSTEISADGSETIVELNKVKINSNLGAFDGGVLTVNDSNVNADASIYAEGGTINLKSSDGSANYTVGEDGIEAEDGGVININGGRINTTYLVANENTTITVNNADVKATDIVVADGQGAVITFDGVEKNTYTVGNGFIAENGGKIYINGGTLQDNNLKSKMYGVKTEEGEILNTASKSLVLDKNGVISTVSDQIYANAASATQKESGAITNEGIDFKGGSLILNDEKFTQSYIDSAQSELKNQGATKLTVKGDVVKDESGEVIKDITVDEASEKYGSDTELDKVTAKADNNLLVGSKDSALADTNIEGVTVKAQVANGFAVGKLDLGAGSDGVVITNDKEVTLGGSEGGSVITVAGVDQDVKVVVGADVGAEKATGSLNIGNSLATEKTQYKLSGEVIVNNESNLNISGQTEITNGLTLNSAMVNVAKGALKTSELKVAGQSNLFGEVNATSLNVASDGILLVGYAEDAEGAGRLNVDEVKLDGGMVFLDPAWKDGATISDASGLAVKNITAADGAYVVGQNSVLALGADLATAESVFAKTEQKWGKDDITAAAYIASTINVANGSLTVDGALTERPTDAIANGSLTMADNSLLMVDGTATKDTAAVTGVSKVTVADSSKLYIDNAKNGETYKIIAGSEEGWKAENVISNNKLLKFNIEESATNDAYDVTAYSNSVKEIYGTAVFAGNVYDAAIAAGGAAAEFVNNASDDHNNADDAAKISALNSAASMGELAGVERGTYAASNLFTDAVAEHMSLASVKEHDSDIWAKYIHSKENIDGLAVAGAGSKYDATFNGIVVGADLYKSGKAAAGVALTYVDGSIKGNTLAARTENDATYYGASIYGGIQNDDSAVIGDISYLHGKNDITQHNSGAALTADAKSDAFSIGVRAEKSVKAGAGKLVPYAGLRYMHLGTGNYTSSIGMSYDGDDMNLWLLPVGVKYSADLKAGGWIIRPIVEAGYVWNMGDRDATQTVSLNGASDGFGFDVADSGSYVGRFVIEAEKANVTYGLGYEYQKGDSVKANKFMANVNWSF